MNSYEDKDPYNRDTQEEQDPYTTGTQEGQNPYTTDPYEKNDSGQSAYTEYREMKTEKSGFSTAALVFGIIALVMLFSCCFTIFSFLPAIAGIVCAMVAKNRTETWEGTALGGFICSIVALVIFLVMIVLGLVSYRMLDTDSLLDQYYYEQDGGGNHHNENGAF